MPAWVKSEVVQKSGRKAQKAVKDYVPFVLLSVSRPNGTMLARS
jgi:hypothetical protein